MPPKAQKQILFPVASPEDYLAKISAENKRLVVLDLHLSWCGWCGVMEQNYRALYFAFENAEQRIEFCTAAEEAIP